MVASPLTLFAAFNAKASANTGTTPRNDNTPNSNGRDFASLLKASSDKGRDNAALSFQSNRRDAGRDDRSASTNDTSNTSTRSTRNNDSTAGADRSSSHDSGNGPVITPKAARKAIEALDRQAANDPTLDPKVVVELKARLQAVVDTNRPMSLQDLFAGASPEEAPALLATLQASVSAGLPVDTQNTFQSIRQMLGRLNKALAVSAETDVAVAADANAQVAAQVQVPASVTAAAGEGNDATITLAAISGEDKKPESPTGENAADTITTITPLAQALLVVPTTTTSVDVSATTKATAAPTEAVAAVDVSSKPVTIDMLIPDLALSADEKKKPLPDVDLPKSTVTAEVAAPKAEPVPPVTALPSKLEQQLQALNGSQQTFAQGLANSEATAKAEASANKPSNVNAAIQPLTGVGAAVGVQATAGIGTVASNIINNAPIREQVHVAISKAAQNGVDQITIQLDPLGLGRVEVKMHTSQDGQTSLAFLVDKPETFDALSRDARGLERALQDSGLKADSSGMQFNLRQQPQAHSDMGGGDRRQGSAHADASVAVSAPAPQTTASTSRSYRVGIQDGVDIHA